MITSPRLVFVLRLYSKPKHWDWVVDIALSTINTSSQNVSQQRLAGYEYLVWHRGWRGFVNNIRAITRIIQSHAQAPIWQLKRINYALFAPYRACGCPKLFWLANSRLDVRPEWPATIAIASNLFLECFVGEAVPDGSRGSIVRYFDFVKNAGDWIQLFNLMVLDFAIK